MDKLPEWTDLRYFLELARAGTLSGSARRLGVEHTTVARRIQRLEAEFKTPLFDRRREGYTLTEVGQALMPHAEAVEGAVLAAAVSPAPRGGHHWPVLWATSILHRRGAGRNPAPVAAQSRGDEQPGR